MGLIITSRAYDFYDFPGNLFLTESFLFCFVLFFVPKRVCSYNTSLCACKYFLVFRSAFVHLSAFFFFKYNEIFTIHVCV